VNVDFLPRSFAPEKGSAALLRAYAIASTALSDTCAKEPTTRSTVKIKKRRVSYSLIIGSARRLRFGERDKRVRHVLTYGIKRFELVHQHVLNYVWSSRGRPIYIYI